MDEDGDQDGDVCVRDVSPPIFVDLLANASWTSVARPSRLKQFVLN